MTKKIFAFILAALILCTPAFAEYDFETDTAQLDTDAFAELDTEAADALEVPAPSAILMEKETGQIICEKNADVRLKPASVTKIMTILLIVEAVENGNLSLDDTVTASAYAAGMGGSQIFLKEGETMSAQDMLKSIVVASANDAAVAMAEHLAGSESAFCERMNKRAAELGMKNTTFRNCTGLLDDPEHLTTARDIAIMSRELIKYDWIKEYTTIWMDTVRGGEFGLSNTNKLIRYFKGATGLKTGFTSEAGYCLSATAEKDGTEYIAVVLNCKTSQDRFESAKALLSYGMNSYVLYSAEPDAPLAPIPVEMGGASYIQPLCDGQKSVLVHKNALASVTKTVTVDENLRAPISEGQKIGSIVIKEGDTVLLERDIVASESVSRLKTSDIFFRILKFAFFGGSPTEIV